MRLLITIFCVVLVSVSSTAALEWGEADGPAHAFPVLRDASGRRRAAGEFRQWIEADGLHVSIAYDFGGGHHVTENGIFRQRPQLAQQHWTWTETRGQRTDRKFEIDFASGRATAAVIDDDGEPKTHDDTMKMADGETFAGFGFTLALRALRARLMKGETVTLKAIGFTPKPQSVDVELSYAGKDRVRLTNRTVTGDKFVIHPKIPAIAKLFVKVPDEAIWLTSPPAGFLRFQGPLAEPKDAIVRVDIQ
jgi:hypothetical protein